MSRSTYKIRQSWILYTYEKVKNLILGKEKLLDGMGCQSRIEIGHLITDKGGLRLHYMGSTVKVALEPTYKAGFQQALSA